MKIIISNGIEIEENNYSYDDSEYLWGNFTIKNSKTLLLDDEKFEIDMIQIVKEDENSEANYYLFIYKNDFNNESTFDIPLDGVFSTEIENEIKTELLKIAKLHYKL